MSPEAAALIVAAGSGSRFGGALPKVFVPLAGAPLLVWSVRAFAAHNEIGAIVCVVAPEYLERAREICAAEVGPGRWQVVAGGGERRESVSNGLRALASTAPEIVAIHDGARPLVTAAIISDSLRACREHGAAIAAIPATDTIKQVDRDGLITATVDRSIVYLAQTPQTFAYRQICQAHERAEREGWAVTDDATLFERLGWPVAVSAGHAHNLKVTVPEDLHLAEWSLGGQSAGRIGHGFDLHRLIEGRALVLGGVTIPHDRGLLGHSDADAALHALSDAILGACALGDIGQHFPDNNPAYAGADSRELTRQVANLARQAGWQIGNADVTIMAQEPKLAPHIIAMRAATAELLGVDIGDVSYKATTTERLGPIGEGLAIAAEAVVLMKPI